ncbi:MAG: glycosyltransferase [Sphingobacteriales bacterium]|nr:glycosyltransferase [Sphingobacteriales bacterium]MBI3717761.1 glycosyltransferase [Sphingobacteriales bacterium]
MDKHLHIISFDVPYPADYGGAIDVFYKIKALHKLGIKIHLQTYEYGRGQQDELLKYCETVNYYKRDTGFRSFSFSLPYIVNSRGNEEMMRRILNDDYPVLMEGLHTTFFYNHPDFLKRKVVLRAHNIESLYYTGLAETENNLFKKIYFKNESRLLEKYEEEVIKKIPTLFMTLHDAGHFCKKENANWGLLPVFHSNETITCQEGIGSYCLYHGNLAIPENEKTAIWLLQNVFNDLQVPFVITGKNPSKKLETMAHEKQNTCIVANPSDKEMNDLIQRAHINILPAFNKTGIRLKLINALYNGRHIVVNDEMVCSTNLESACHVGNNAAGMKSIIVQLYHKPFTEDEIKLREKLLNTYYNNDNNARKLIPWLY